MFRAYLSAFAIFMTCTGSLAQDQNGCPLSNPDACLLMECVPGAVGFLYEKEDGSAGRISNNTNRKPKVFFYMEFSPANGKKPSDGQCTIVGESEMKSTLRATDRTALKIVNSIFEEESFTLRVYLDPADNFNSYRVFSWPEGEEVIADGK